MEVLGININTSYVSNGLNSLSRSISELLAPIYDDFGFLFPLACMGSAEALQAGEIFCFDPTNGDTWPRAFQQYVTQHCEGQSIPEGQLHPLADRFRQSMISYVESQGGLVNYPGVPSGAHLINFSINGLNTMSNQPTTPCPSGQIRLFYNESEVCSWLPAVQAFQDAGVAEPEVRDAASAAAPALVVDAGADSGTLADAGPDADLAPEIEAGIPDAAPPPRPRPPIPGPSLRSSRSLADERLDYYLEGSMPFVFSFGQARDHESWGGLLGRFMLQYNIRPDHHVIGIYETSTHSLDLDQWSSRDRDDMVGIYYTNISRYGTMTGHLDFISSRQSEIDGVGDIVGSTNTSLFQFGFRGSEFNDHIYYAMDFALGTYNDAHAAAGIVQIGTNWLFGRNDRWGFLADLNIYVFGKTGVPEEEAYSRVEMTLRARASLRLSGPWRALLGFGWGFDPDNGTSQGFLVIGTSVGDMNHPIQTPMGLGRF